MQRMIAARAAALHPEIYSFLRDGQLNLSAVARLAPFLTAANRTEILSRAAGRKRAALDEMLGELRATQARGREIPPEVGDGAPPEFVLPFAGSPGDAPATERAGGEPPNPDRAVISSSSGGCRVDNPSSAERPVRLSFSADEGLRRDLARARRLLEQRCPSGRLEDMVAYLLRDFLRRCDPDARTPSPERPRRERETRRVPRWVKDRVWTRDGGRCAYAASDGRRCTARKGLEYDHLRAWARGGSSDDPANIRLLCRAHNLFLARRDFAERVPPRRVSG